MVGRLWPAYSGIWILSPLIKKKVFKVGMDPLWQNILDLLVSWLYIWAGLYIGWVATNCLGWEIWVGFESTVVRFIECPTQDKGVADSNPNVGWNKILYPHTLAMAYPRKTSRDDCKIASVEVKHQRMVMGAISTKKSNVLAHTTSLKLRFGKPNYTYDT